MPNTGLLNSVAAALEGVCPVYVGEQPTGALVLPSIILRYEYISSDNPRSVAGTMISHQVSLRAYCRANSCEAAMHLATLVADTLDGIRVGGALCICTVSVTSSPTAMSSDYWENSVGIDMEEAGSVWNT